jgi:hypothetical protein
MLLVTVLLLQLLLLLHLTDSCASRCCGRPIWSIENHKFDAFLDVCDRKIHTDTYRYALRNTVRYSQIQSDMHCFQNCICACIHDKNTYTYIAFEQCICVCMHCEIQSDTVRYIQICTAFKNVHVHVFMTKIHTHMHCL